MHDIVITEFMDEQALGNVPSRYSVHYDPQLVETPDRIAELARDARALIVRNRTQVTADLLDRLARLECVGRLGVGLDNIDLAACAARNVDVYPATGTNDLSVAEYVMTMALVLRRGSYFSSAQVAAGDWPRQQLIGQEVFQATIGLIGLGAIARQVVPRALAFGMNILGHDPFVADDDPVWRHVERAGLDDLLARTDIVSLHTPLTAETRHLADRSFFARMKPGAILINAARGGVVDEQAAIEALDNGTLSGLALDVFDTEPLSADAGSKFGNRDNIILTPHIAGVTRQANRRISFATIANVLKKLDSTNG